MKYFQKFALLVSASLMIASCSNDISDKIESQKNSNSFGKSVIILQNGENSDVSKRSTGTETTESPKTIRLINFNPNLKLNIEYNIDDIKYTDSGEYNDEIAGDGIYTSVETFPIEKSANKEAENDIILNIGNNFKYRSNLSGYLKTTYGYGLNEVLHRDKNKRTLTTNEAKPKVYVEVGCDIVTRPCPETHWYNTCIFSSPCTCIYLENCELSVGVEV